MITTEILKNLKFFSNIDQMNDRAAALGIEKIFLAPSVSINPNENELSIILETQHCPIANRLRFQAELRALYEPKIEFQFFSFDAIRESIEERDPATPRLMKLLNTAIPLADLNDQEPLEEQWGRYAKVNVEACGDSGRMKP